MRGVVDTATPMILVQTTPSVGRSGQAAFCPNYRNAQISTKSVDDCVPITIAACLAHTILTIHTIDKVKDVRTTDPLGLPAPSISALHSFERGVVRYHRTNE